MHYYSFNVADYRKDTVHLSPIEHYIYRSLLDSYYLNETPISSEKDSLLRILRLSKKESKSLENVLNEFFELSGNFYIHQRVEKELSKIYEKSEKAKTSAKARWDNANAMRTQCERNANGMLPNNPIPNNPIPKEKDIRSNALVKESKKKEFNGKDCEELFLYWQSVMIHPNAKLLPKRKSLIQKTLDAGYTPIQIRLAIDGHKKSKWHKENGFDGIEYSLKPENIDKFIKQAGMTDAELNNGAINWNDWSFTDGLQAELGVRPKDYRKLS